MIIRKQVIILIKQEFLNTKETATAMGISTSYLRKLEKLGLPYHQLSPDSYKYFNLGEITEWLKTAGFRQKAVWRKEN